MKFNITLILGAMLVLPSYQIIAPTPDLDEDWMKFKLKYSKTYKEEYEEFERRIIWEENLDFILQHNDEYEQGLHSFTLGENEFADLTHEEFVKTMTGCFLPSTIRNDDDDESPMASSAALPDSVDWRAKGCVGPVGNQLQCGSCWAFTATGSLEGINCKQTGNLIVLSVQQLMDCSSKQGNHGCEGGMMDFSYTYIKESGGLVPEKDYPYKPEEDACKFNKSERRVTDTGFHDIKKGDEMALQAAVAAVGPVANAIDASQRTFQLYKSGVYDEPKCSKTRVDHSLVIVGYGTLDGKQYYEAKNSWGTSWGDEGYVKLSRNKNNQCGVATTASYPTGVSMVNP